MVHPKTKHSQHHDYSSKVKKHKVKAKPAYLQWLDHSVSDDEDLDDWFEAGQEMLKNVFERDNES